MVKKRQAIGCVIPRIALDGLFLVSSKDYVSSSFESSSGPLWPVTSRMRNSIDKEGHDGVDSGSKLRNMDRNSLTVGQRVTAARTF